MSDLVIYTYDWVPDLPRGYVRDLRVRWALEEVGASYRVESVSFRNRGVEHYANQPFGQIPWLTDGDVSIFESGAILLYIAERHDGLMPRDQSGRYEVVTWLFAALNSVEMASVPWSLYQFAGDESDTPGRRNLEGFLESRLQRLDDLLGKGRWLAGNFSIADIVMTDALRLVGRFDGLADYPACRRYVDRATSRPAFIKAHEDQIAHFAAAD